MLVAGQMQMDGGGETDCLMEGWKRVDGREVPRIEKKASMLTT